MVALKLFGDVDAAGVKDGPGTRTYPKPLSAATDLENKTAPRVEGYGFILTIGANKLGALASAKWECKCVKRWVSGWVGVGIGEL